jgi:hypothetical protein
MTRLRDSFNAQWPNTTGWTLTGALVTATADAPNKRVAIVGATTSITGRLVHGTSFACPSGQVDRLWFNVGVQFALDTHGGAPDSYELHVLVVDAANHNGTGARVYGFENVPFTIGGSFVQGALQGARGGVAYSEPTRQLLGIEVDNAAQVLRVKALNATLDPMLDATWVTSGGTTPATLVDEFAFGAISPAFDPSNYHVEIEVVGFSAAASTAHVGELNAGVGAPAAPSSGSVFGVDRRRRAIAAIHHARS